jgi:hypothetical protein
MTDEIIKQMAKIEGDVDVAGNWCPPDGGYEKYNPLDLSQLGRLVEKFKIDLTWIPSDIGAGTEYGLFWEAIVDGRSEDSPDLMTAACKAIIAAHGEKRDE